MKYANVVLCLSFTIITVVSGYYATKEKTPIPMPEPELVMIPGPSCPYVLGR